MPSRILLISSNRCADPYPVFPLGLAHIDTALRAAGHQTELFDAQADTRSLSAVVSAFDPQYVGVSCRNIDDVQAISRQTFFDDVFAVARTVRELTQAPLILGGSAFSLYPERLLDQSGAEFGIQGEGEQAFVSLIAALENGDDYRTVPSLVYRDSGRVVINARSPLAGTAILTADRSAPLVTHYLQQSSMLNLQTQRGCGFQCCYCTYPLIEGRQPRRRDPAVVAEEFATLQAQGARHVFVADSVLNTSADHVRAVCEALLRRGVKISWSCFLRPAGLDLELMQLLARAGLTHVEFGADSLCDNVLAEYGKSFTYDDIRRTSELAREAKIHYCHFLIAGGPGETEDTLRTTFARSLELPGAIIFAMGGMRIYPGTSLAARALREGQINSQTDLLQPVYYVSPALPAERLRTVLEEFAQRARNWIVGPLPPFFQEFAARMRARGVVGPLWEFFPALRPTT